MNLSRILRLCLYSAFLLAIYSVRLFISPLWLLAISVFLMCGLLIQYKILPTLPSFFLNTLSILGIMVCLLFFSHSEIISIFIYPLLILGSVKFLGNMRSRDMWEIYLICFFVLCGAATYNFDLEFGVILVIFTVISTVGLVCLNVERGPRRLSPLAEKRLLSFSFIWSMSIVVFATIFFVFLPRSPFSLFSGLSFTSSAKTGFTEEINLEKVKDLLESSDVAFRVLVEMPFTFRPYWRGIVYETYGDGRWSVFSLPKEKTTNSFSLGTLGKIKQVFYLEPYDGSSLFTLEYPCKLAIKAKWPQVIRVWENLTFSLTHMVTKRMRYEVYSNSISYLPKEYLPNKNIYLQVPQDIKQKLRELARSLIRNRVSDNLEIAGIINQYLHSQAFQYSLQAPRKETLDPIIQFLFHTHKGWCEHFASAFVLLLRSIGIPARVVGGYVGGQWNALGHYYLVRQSDAHTWAEVWQNGKGWVRFDPTPISHKSYSQFFLTKFMDYLRLRWYAYIINYDFALQHKIIRHLTRCAFHPKWVPALPKTGLKVFFKGIIIIVGLSLSLFFIYKYYISSNYYQRLKRILVARGFKVKPYQTGTELARMVSEKQPKRGELIIEFIKTWYGIRYGGVPIDREKKQYLRQILRQINKKSLNG